MQVPPPIHISSIHAAVVDRKSIFIPISIEDKDIETLGLLDSGAGGEFINQNFTKKLHLKLQDLDKLIKAYNVDGTLNKMGTIKSYVDLNLTIYGQSHNTRLYVTGLGKQKIILGLPWLQERNPIINWKDGTIEWKTTKKTSGLKFYRTTDGRIKLNQTNPDMTSTVKPVVEVKTETSNETVIPSETKDEMEQPDTSILDDILSGMEEEECEDDIIMEAAKQLASIHKKTVEEQEQEKEILKLFNEEEEFSTVMAYINDHPEIWINAKGNLAQDLAIEANAKKVLGQLQF